MSALTVQDNVTLVRYYKGPDPLAGKTCGERLRINLNVMCIHRYIREVAFASYKRSYESMSIRHGDSYGPPPVP